MFFFQNSKVFYSLLFAITATAYVPALMGGFVFDDELYILENPLLQMPDGPLRAWFQPAAEAWHPFVMCTFWLEYQAWGEAAFGYHAVNLLLHIGNCFLIAHIFKKLGLPWGDLAALMFALHPTHLESVGWITERKDVLSGLFFFLTIKVWLDFQESRLKWKYLVSLGLFALALTAKSSVAPLPAVLLLAQWWRNGRIHLRDCCLTAPYFCASGLLAGIYVAVEKSQALPLGPEFEFNLAERCLIASRAVWFYLGKLLLPYPLMPIYPRWSIDTGDWIQFLHPVSLVAMLAVLWARREAWGRGPLFAMAGFILMLSPSLGFISFSFMRFSFVADHFQYLASLFPLGAMAAALSRIRHPWGQRLIAPSLTVLLLAWGGIIFAHGFAYRDNLTYWKSNLQANPHGYYPRFHYGSELMKAGRHSEAEQVFRDGIGMLCSDEEKTSKLHCARIHYNLAWALGKQGKANEAIAELRGSLEAEPNYANGHRNLAIGLAGVGKKEEAERHFRIACDLEPGSGDFFNDYGLWLKEEKRLSEAAGLFREGIKSNSGYAPLHFNLGLTLLEMKEYDPAMEAFNLAMKLAPEQADSIRPILADAHYRAGGKHLERGEMKEALEDFEIAAELNPRNGDYQRALKEIRGRLPME